MLAQHAARLRVCLQHATGDSEGPEEGSDAWLLLDALISNDYPDLCTCFEQSGRWLAEQGGKLDVRLQALQRYFDALALEFKDLFKHVSVAGGQDRAQLLIEATTRLYRLQSTCMLALTRGYQCVMDEVSLERNTLAKQIEERFQALQQINGVSNSNTDLDQTLEVITKIVAEEMKADLCSVFFYDELQRMLTLRATNGPVH